MSENNDVIVDSITLTEFLKNNLAIPEYQRPYAWSEDLVLKFVNQINLYFERKKEFELKNPEKKYPKYYIGSIVLHNDGDNLNIIDGQQRLTTLLLICTLKKDNHQKDLKFHHPLSINRIKNNFEFLKLQNSFSDSPINNVIKQINLDDLNVTTVITTNEDLAYNFFETLNTGGVRLSGTDILKAYHLRVLEKNKIKIYARNWESKQEYLEDVNQILLKSRKLNILDDNPDYPGKYASINDWKIAITKEFSENTGKIPKDIGFADVTIEKNTHTIISDKYSLRQPLNDGENYINYLLNFTRDYEMIFHPADNFGLYKKFNDQIIDVIDGTVDLRSYYKIALMCFVDKYGTENLVEFSFWLFRTVYSIRVGDKSRIFEATVKNFFLEKKLLERILFSYTYQEILDYFKKQDFYITKDLSYVGARFLDRTAIFFDLNIIDNKYEIFDQKLKNKITQICNEQHYV